MEFEIPLVSLIMLILLIVFYLSKENLKLIQNKIFKVILISSLLEAFLNFLVHLICSVRPYEILISIPYYNFFNLLNKVLVILFIIIFESLFCYVLVISSGSSKIKSKKVRVPLLIVNILSLIVLSFSKISIINANTAINVVGSTPTFGYFMIGVFVTLSLIVTIKNMRNIDKRYLPIIVIFILLIICYAVTIFIPGMILYDLSLTILCYLMFFTIENPDAKMLREVYKAKEISDNANYEKEIFIYNITQEVKKTTRSIDDEAEYIIDSDSLEEDKERARNIKRYTSDFRIITNDILDVNLRDVSNVKIYNTKYNIKNLVREIVSIYKIKTNERNIKFRTNIEHFLNEQLYGDTINLKKVLCDILDYSLNKTSKGYIELNINSIIRKNVCRLIISIEDSSSFNNLDINDIKTNPKNELYDVYRLVVLLDGTMSVLSNLNGNVIKVILDQRMEEHEEVIDKYSNIFNNKKVLVVDDILATYKIIEKLLKDSDIELFGVLSGRECLDKIRNKEKFDLILLDEDLHYMSGDEVVKKLHSIRNFDIPVVLLTKDSNVEYDNSYKENGFDDYLLKPINKNKLNEVLNKYL
jgi:CheY-like chemotaxis protein/signal transduction histidine kinase